MHLSHLLLLVLLKVVIASLNHNKITITTTLGNITGNVHKKTAVSVYEFLGIQYGIAPIGSLRFRPSQLNTSWNTSYNATTYGPVCIQSGQKYNNYVMDEDCLYLNIWTPQIDQNNLLPVMFWIHGGSMQHGTGSAPTYDGINFVGNGKDFILVTINYRLALLGFLQSQQLYNEDPNWPSYGGLNGIYDQINAIKWVKQYIQGFGGDPNQITVFGESAGGTSTCFLLISPMVPKDIFQRAIIQSGACSGPWEPVNKTYGLTECNNILESHGLPTNISDLRKLPANDFKIAARCYAVDDLILTELPYITYGNLNATNATFNTNELIMGFNSMDGIIGYPWHGGTTPRTPQQYDQYLNYFISNQTQIDLIKTVYYPLTDFPAYQDLTNASIAWESINGDVCVSCPTMNQMEEILNSKWNNHNFKGYVYEFRGGGPPFYAPHGSEIPFIFDHESNDTFYTVPWNQKLSDSMLSAWTNYGKYGFPNVTITDGNFEWKQFTMNNKNVIVWDNNIRNEANYVSRFRHGACPFWYEQVGTTIAMQICYDKVHT